MNYHYKQYVYNTIYILLVIMSLIALLLVFNKFKSPRFEDNDGVIENIIKEKAIGKEDMIIDRPCLNKEGIEVVCKG